MLESESDLILKRIPLRKLDKDLLEASIKLNEDEVRYMVDAYYQMQEYRKASANQIRSQDIEPSGLLGWYMDHLTLMEGQIKRAMDQYAKHHKIGQRMLTVCGIGPVITAGLISHLDPKKPTVGHWWSFAGLVPGQEWKKGEKRPWNARLKTLCWKVGDSFKKQSGRENCFYGKVYQERKKLEVANNEAEMFTDQAEAKLKRFKIGKKTDAYKHYSVGKLPPAHLDQRAMRYATKLFLSHLHEKWYELETGKKAPQPFVIQHLGHVDYIGGDW